MSPRGRVRIPLFALTALCLIFGACSDGDGDPAAPAAPVDHAPRIIALTAAPSEVGVGGVVTLTVAAEDDDGAALAYAWSADAGGFPQGSQAAEVIWQAPATAGECLIRAVVSDGSAQARDSLTVSVVQPVLAAAPAALDFGDEATVLEFTVTNVGSGVLDWVASAGQDWLTATPAAGETTTETDLVTVTATRAGLAPGDYDGTVTITSDGGSATLAVTLEVAAAAPPPNLFFLHHSTGRYLIDAGDVRNLLAGIDPDLEFWDHDYSYIGLMDPSGDLTGDDYRIPDDNTDPDGLHVLWTTDNSARTAILANHDVIAFKSCYPASRILSDTELATRKQWYLEMRDVFDQHPDKVFVVVSQPPLHRLNSTSTDQADRARAFADWLMSDEYLAGHPNVAGFDLFDLLAHPDDGTDVRNRLRYEYEKSHSDDDSHPNTLANQTVAPFFAQAMAAAAGVR